MIDKNGKPSVMIALSLARKNKGGSNGQNQDEGKEEETGSEMNDEKDGPQDRLSMMKEMRGKMEDVMAMMEEMVLNMEE